VKIRKQEAADKPLAILNVAPKNLNSRKYETKSFKQAIEQVKFVDMTKSCKLLQMLKETKQKRFKLLQTQEINMR